MYRIPDQDLVGVNVGKSVSKSPTRAHAKLTRSSEVHNAYNTYSFSYHITVHIMYTRVNKNMFIIIIILLRRFQIDQNIK